MVTANRGVLDVFGGAVFALGGLATSASVAPTEADVAGVDVAVGIHVAVGTGDVVSVIDSSSSDRTTVMSTTTAIAACRQCIASRRSRYSSIVSFTPGQPFVEDLLRAVRGSGVGASRANWLTRFRGVDQRWVFRP